jgi:hypothetical protein
MHLSIFQDKWTEGGPGKIEKILFKLSANHVGGNG